MLNSLRLASKFLCREVRYGEWLLVLATLVITISAITAINFFVERLHKGLDKQASQFIGGDLAVATPTAIPPLWYEKAQELSLKFAEVWSYPSVIHSADKFQLVNVQAVSEQYPLLTKDKLVRNGFILVDKRLLSALSLKLNDSMTIGNKSFVVQNILTSETDIPNTGWQIAPRVVIALADVYATKTVVPGSRIDYRFLLSGNNENIKKFIEWIKPQLKPGQQLINVKNQSASINNIIQRMENYLYLTLLICILVGGVTIYICIDRYIQSRVSHIALWRCLGAKQNQITLILFWQLISIAIIAGMLGVALGYTAHILFVSLFNDLLPFILPATTWKPALIGLACSLLMMFAFALSAMIELPRVSPMSLWRQNFVPSYLPSVFYMTFVLILLGVFVYYFMIPMELTVYFLLAVFLSIIILNYIFNLLLYMLRFVISKTEGFVRRGLQQLVQYQHNAKVQFISFSLIAVFLLSLNMIKSNLINDWRTSMPKGTPNYFMFNLGKDDLPQFEKKLLKENIIIDGVYPMVRGRLIEVNHQPVLQVIPKSAVNNGALHRELNLSWMTKLPSDNKILSGNPIEDKHYNQPVVSVEVKLANDLNLKLGDILTFALGDQNIKAKIINFRSVDWGSFHPNFFIIFAPGVLQDKPHTWITSVFVPENRVDLLNTITELFPNVTVLDVSDLLNQLQNLLKKVILSAQYLFLFSLLLSLLLVVACYQATKAERNKTYYLLRILGAKYNYIRNSTMVEYATLILFVAMISYVVSSITVLWIKAQIYQI